jgi:hypothetical protein
VDNFLPCVDSQSAKYFFRAQAVDDIGAGGGGLCPLILGRVPSGIPSLRTGAAACLHKLSTGLCTARFDVAVHCHETVGAIAESVGAFR